MAKIINKFGEMIGWNNITVNIFGRDLEGITELSYTDEVAVEGVYGAGRMPVGFSKGNYSATAKITLKKEESLAIMNSLPPGVRIQDIPPFSVIAKYEKDGSIFNDVIQNCIFKNSGAEVKQNDGSIEHAYDLFTTHIDYNIK